MPSSRNPAPAHGEIGNQNIWTQGTSRHRSFRRIFGAVGGAEKLLL
jgi:hypothetical protein